MEVKESQPLSQLLVRSAALPLHPAVPGVLQLWSRLLALGAWEDVRPGGPTPGTDGGRGQGGPCVASSRVGWSSVFLWVSCHRGCK